MVLARQPQAPENPNEPIFLQQFGGLVNTRTEERLGPQDLIVAKNIDIDDAKQVRRRRGRTLKLSGAWHSILTAAKGNSFGVRDGDFVRVYPDYSVQTLRSGVGPARLSYVEIGDMLYANSETTGFKVNILTDTAEDWGALDGNGQWLSPVLQPTSTLGEIAGKLLRNPPRARYMTYFNGRIYMAMGNVVWATELYQYDYVDATRTYMMFEGEVTGLGTVGEGIYVGTDKGCYFCRGTFGEMRKNPVTPDPVIAGSMIPGNPVDFPGTQTKLCVLFLTSAGLTLGLDAGNVKNLTSDKFNFPDAVDAVAAHRSQDGISQYIGVVNSGGSPASAGARVGDYVDAEIRRFQGA